jgi:hypothetical protein
MIAFAGGCSESSRPMNDGGSRSGDGSTGPRDAGVVLPTAADRFCVDLASAECARRQRCAPIDFQSAFESVAACERHEELDCLGARENAEALAVFEAVAGGLLRYELRRGPADLWAAPRVSVKS